MLHQTAVDTALVLVALCAAVTGCGGGGGGSSGSTGSAPQPAVIILGLPIGPTRAERIALRVEADAGATVRWTLVNRDGTGSQSVYVGSAIDIAVPEGELVITVLAGSADGRERTASAVLVVDRTPPSIRLRELQVSGSMSAAAHVAVAGVADQDGADDTAFVVALACDGGAGLSSLPVDDGQGLGYDLPLSVDGQILAMRLEETP